MNDLIYRQLAVNAIDKYNVHGWVEEHFEDLEKALLDIPSAQPEVTEEAVKDYCHKRRLTVLTNEFLHYLKTTPPTASQWIPCSERLPNLTGSYIVTGKMKYSFEKEWEYFTDVAYSFGKDIDHFWDTCNDWDEGQEIHIIAWMPLPEPWKGE